MLNCTTCKDTGLMKYKPIEHYMPHWGEFSERVCDCIMDVNDMHDKLLSIRENSYNCTDRIEQHTVLSMHAVLSGKYLVGYFVNTNEEADIVTKIIEKILSSRELNYEIHYANKFDSDGVQTTNSSCVMITHSYGHMITLHISSEEQPTDMFDLRIHDYNIPTIRTYGDFTPVAGLSYKKMGKRSVDIMRRMKK